MALGGETGDKPLQKAVLKFRVTVSGLLFVVARYLCLHGAYTFGPGSFLTPSLYVRLPPFLIEESNHRRQVCKSSWTERNMQVLVTLCHWHFHQTPR